MGGGIASLLASAGFGIYKMFNQKAVEPIKFPEGYFLLEIFEDEPLWKQKLADMNVDSKLRLIEADIGSIRSQI